MGKRQQQRQEEREMNQLITLKAAKAIMEEQYEKLKRNYEIVYTLAAISALNSEPFGFGRKRLGDFTEAYIGQIAALGKQAIDFQDLSKPAADLGIKLSHNGNEFHIDFSDYKGRARR